MFLELGGQPIAVVVSMSANTIQVKKFVQREITSTRGLLFIAPPCCAWPSASYASSAGASALPYWPEVV